MKNPNLPQTAGVRTFRLFFIRKEKANPAALLLLTFFLLVAFIPSRAENADPVIDIWYGSNQSFGNNGEPQVWCNILGNVSDTDGSVSSLSYKLNSGSTMALTIGGDDRRLLSSGDFNIDLEVADLLPGANTVEITAMDDDNGETMETVTVNYTAGNTWPNPYTVNWGSLSGIAEVNEVAHVVDGDFYLTPDGIRTAAPGYDRLIAIGDRTWSNYQVLVPVTIHNMPGGGGVGVLLRWTGHTDNPVTCAQPKCGWLPLGDIAWYRPGELEFYQGGSTARTLNTGVTYLFRTAVQTSLDGFTTYQLRVWEEGTNEPTTWDLVNTVGPADEQEGSLLLISHKADVTFGDVMVTPAPLTISNIAVAFNDANTEATITWNTDQAATSQVDYGPTNAYEDGGILSGALVTSHSVTLSNLTPNSVYHYQITSQTAGQTETAVSDDLTFSTSLQRDDFCESTLNTSVWNFENPGVGDASYDLTGSGTSDARLEIDVPGGNSHEIFNNGIRAPNMLQSIDDADFLVEVKFDSPVQTPQYQEQGILVKESASRYLRFEFYSKGTGMAGTGDTHIYAHQFGGSEPGEKIDAIIGSDDVAPLYMRVQRIGNQYIQTCSTDGVAWQAGASFTSDIVPVEIGPYAGNESGASSPQHTGQIDYFLNQKGPYPNEDVCTASSPPVLGVIGEPFVEEGATLNVAISATDDNPDPATLSFSATGLPSFAQLTNNGNGTATLALNPNVNDDGTYTGVRVTVTDSDMQSDFEDFRILVSKPGTGPPNLISDDFYNGVLGSDWTFVDPQNDASFQITGALTGSAWATFTVPGPNEHQLWRDGIQAPHIIQEANDTDFEVEVRMESDLTQQYQEQGILVKQDNFNFLRFEIFSNTSQVVALAAILSDTDDTYPINSSIEINSTIGPHASNPPYLRVKREGNTWEMYYSAGPDKPDEEGDWTLAGSFNHPLEVIGVGIYGGNGTGTSAPAHVAQFDYFESQESEITNEDNNLGAFPVELTGFTARTREHTVLLNWTTASELNNDFFEVQHSTDGREYTLIGTVNGAGTTSDFQHYRFVHPEPRPGVNYYRLRQVDFDGAFEYSPVRTVRLAPKGGLTAYPNPAGDELYLQTTDELTGEPVAVYNAYGEPVIRSRITGPLTTLDVNHLPSGVYFIQLTAAAGVAPVRVVVR